MKRLVANISSTLVALLAGAAAIYFSNKMREPQGTLDWLSLLFAGLIVGLIAFFLTWGHFQSEPGAPEKGPAFPVVTDRPENRPS